MRIARSAIVLLITALGCADLDQEPVQLDTPDLDTLASFWQSAGACYQCGNVYGGDACTDRDQACVDVESGSVTVRCFAGETLDESNGCFPHPSGDPAEFCCCAPGVWCPGLWP